jgi:hypothetical protein
MKICRCKRFYFIYLGLKEGALAAESRKTICYALLRKGHNIRMHQEYINFERHNANEQRERVCHSNETCKHTLIFFLRMRLSGTTERPVMSIFGPLAMYPTHIYRNEGVL